MSGFSGNRLGAAACGGYFAENGAGSVADAANKAAKSGVLDVDVRRLTAMPLAIKIRCLGQCPLVYGG